MSESSESEESMGFKDMKKIFQDAKEQLLIFSGNLSFINFNGSPRKRVSERHVLPVFKYTL